MNSKLLGAIAAVAILAIFSMALYWNKPTLVKGLFHTQTAQDVISLDNKTAEQMLSLARPIDADTLQGNPGIYYLQAENITGQLSPLRFSAYDSLVQQGYISANAQILTDQNSPSTSSEPSLQRLLSSLNTDQLAEGSLQLYWTTGRFNNALSTAKLKTSQLTSGLLAINRGGTGGSQIPVAGGIAYGSGSAYAFTKPGVAGDCLISQASLAPSWGSCGHIAANSLNFTHIANSLALDANTSIALGGGLTLSTTGAGSLSFAHTGLTTFSGQLLINSGQLALTPQNTSTDTTSGSIYFDADDFQLKVYTNGRWQADRSTATTIVAASNSTNKEKADFIASGTNDEATIQAAIDNLPSAGGSVILLEGNYSFINSLFINKNNVNLVGQGDSTHITKSTAGHGIEITGSSANRLSHIYVGSLSLSGPSTVTDQVVGSGIQLNYTDYVNIEKATIAGFGSQESQGAVEVMRSTHCRVTKSSLSNSKNGIITGRATDASEFPWADSCIFSHNQLFSNFDDGGHSQHSRSISWSNNYAYGNGTTGGDSAGIDTLGDEGDVITGNIIYGTTTQQKGIEVGNSSSSGVGSPDTGHIVSNNIISNTTAAGITIGNRSQRITVTGNSVRNSGSHGISVGTSSSSRQSVDNLIIGNTTANNGSDGIRVTGNAYRNLIKNNISINNSNRGLSITVASGQTPQDNIVQGNQFMGNGASTQFSDAGIGTDIRFNTGTDFDIQINSGGPALTLSGTLVASGGIQIGGGTLMLAIYSSTTTWDPPAISPGQAASTTLTVNGASPGDVVSTGFSQDLGDGVIISANVSSADTVRVTIGNQSANPVDIGAGTLRVQVNKF